MDEQTTSQSGARAARLAALLLALAAASIAAPARAEAPAPPAGLRGAALSFETARLLPEASRAAALDQADHLAVEAAKGARNDDENQAARYLWAQILLEKGNVARASEALHQSADGLGKSPYADDAELQSIQALEAQGKDADAAKAWVEWEKRFPQSPLWGEAKLAQAWNALRRGQNAPAEKLLAALLAKQPWYAGDARVQLARATALYANGKAAEALALVGPKPGGAGGAAAAYLRALCHRSLGSMLASAAAFQEVAGRYPDSPLRDPALLGKADAFLRAHDYRSAAEEFARAAKQAKDPNVVAEAEVRAAGAVSLTGASDSALALFHGIVERRPGTDQAARAQFLIGDMLATRGQYAEAIVELNRVLTNYFQHSVAASAQYRVARCLDALGRKSDATGSYQAVVSGYPLEPEAPAAAYMAGVGLLAQNRPRAAAPYFQIVLDRYVASAMDSTRSVRPITPERQELIDAALCLLLYSYRTAGDLGQVAGAPHLLLQKMPPSHNPWRAYALLIDADAMAAQSRHPEAQETLEKLIHDFPDHPVGASAAKLLAWTYAQQGKDSLAVQTEEKLVLRYGATDQVVVAGALLDIAHDRFNQKRYREAAAGYEDFLKRFPASPKRHLANYQAGLAYVRLNRLGDAVDHWEAIVRDSSKAPIAEKAWARAGDLYFQAQRYSDAKRCYRGLLENFATTDAAALATLRMGQCEYNAGNDAAALEAFSQAMARFPDSPYAKEAKRGTELALYRLGQSDKGTAVLAQLVEQYPNSAYAADALFQIAKNDYQAKRYDKASDGFRRVVSQFPGYSAADQAQYLLADALDKAGKPAEARQASEQFLAFFPESDLRPTVQFQLGLQQFQNKEYAPAAVAFTQVLADSAAPDVRAASRYNLALCQRSLGQTEEARVTLEAYRAERPADSRADEVAYQLGDIHDTAGRYADAQAEFEKALDGKPSAALETELRFRVGRCLEEQQKIDEATRWYIRASQAVDRRNAFRLSAVARLAAIYESKREFGKAMAAYQDIASYSKDRELAQAAAGRASQLRSSRTTR
ncbi:MAG TPA: tetratricopeptide repeat protein [Candidatus Binatia bacterium]|nr:tetratricopeptide repeat protein [Candidatus Binatia bacterium]